MKRDFLSITDLAPGEFVGLIHRAVQMKRRTPRTALARKEVALLFEKPSLRTRASFEVAVSQLGGHAFYMGRDEVGLGKREPVSDVVKMLSRVVHCIVARVFEHKTLVEMARYASIPVVNALSDLEHPCQCLADLLTVYEKKGRLEGLKVVFVGDWNNVSRSLALGCAMTGANFTLASPAGYELDDETLNKARSLAKKAGKGVTLEVVRDPKEAARSADVVYTDVWTSMGQEAEAEKRRRDFQGYTVDDKLLSLAKKDVIFMHDMPAHYGEEVPPGMLDHSRSVVFDQAENRLHAQKALLEFLLKD